MTTSSVCRAVAAAIAVPAMLIAAPAIAMAAGAAQPTTVHQVTIQHTTANPVVHQPVSSTEHTVAQLKKPTASTTVSHPRARTGTTPVVHQVAGTNSVAAQQQPAPVVAKSAAAPRGWHPCDGDAYACYHWNAAYHWDAEYHVLGYNVEAGHYWNAGAYGELSNTHSSHGHYWNAGSHVNVSQDYGGWHHNDDNDTDD